MGQSKLTDDQLKMSTVTLKKQMGTIRIAVANPLAIQATHLSSEVPAVHLRISTDVWQTQDQLAGDNQHTTGPQTDI